MLIAWWRLYTSVLRDLPDVSQIKSMVFSQATVIADRNGEILYKVFAENREYIPLTGVSENMINAIVAMEDKRYWEHNGLDTMGIIRAAIHNLTNPGGSLQGASTISQQLVLNLLLSRGRTFYEKVTRKIKEIVLTTRLDSILEKQIRKENSKLSNDELRRKMKETVLELYLNYIFFGNNAYGIEAASKTYFGTSAINLDILQSAIIASIPKWPSIYEPYRNKGRLMGKFNIQDPTGETIIAWTWLQDAIYIRAKSIVEDANLKNKNENNEFINFIAGLLDFNIDYEGVNYKVKYESGRKDLALARMFEDWYIDDIQLRNAFIEWLNYQFKSHKFEITAPHFVHWIIEKLEEDYDKETLQQWGFVIKTTLDINIQKKAEEIIASNPTDKQTYGAANKSMVYIDSTNGDVLAYVWSMDYFNDEIEGKNDMVRRPRQVWSTMKPFTYAYGFMNLPLTEDTPIFDIPSNFWGDEPDNADSKFLWLLPLKQALAYSRNIPAIKMFLAAWWEEAIKPFLKKLGMTSLSDTVEYWYPLTLGAGEIPALELANAYAHLTANTEPAEINPILEIRARDWSLLYEKEVKKQEKVIPSGVGYLLWDILSSPENMPSTWVGMFSVRWLKLGIKSGTSNVQTDRGNRPRDGWLVAYTPSKVAVFWAGNTDASPLNRNAFGGTINGTEMRNFFSWLRDNNLIVNETINPVDISEVQISKISGKLAGDNTPTEFVVSSKAYNETRPSTTDAGATRIEFDKACNGLLSPYTPLEDRSAGFVINPISFMPSNMDLNDIKTWFQRWSTKDTGWIEELSQDQKSRYLWTTFNYPNIFLTAPTEICENRIANADTEIKLTIVWPKANGWVARKSAITYRIEGPRKLKEVIIHINDIEVGRTRYAQARDNITDVVPINIPTTINDGNATLKVIAVDTDSFSNNISQSITVTSTDTKAPVLENAKVITDPNDGTKSARLFFSDDVSYVAGGQVTQNGTKIADIKSSLVSFPVSTIWEVEVTVKDAYDNTLTQKIDLSKY